MKKIVTLSLVFVLLLSFTLLSFADGFRVEKSIRVPGGVSSNTIKLDDGSYWMYYTGQDIMVAESADGLTFTNNRTVLALSDVKTVFPEVTQISNSAIIKRDGGTYRMIFEGKSGTAQTDPRRLYSATSLDGLTNWQVETGVRLEDIIDGTSIVFTSVPDIIGLPDGRLRMYYTVGLKSKSAVSSDEGITWTKEGNIKLNKKFKSLVDADVTKIGKKYVLLFATLPVTGNSKKAAKGKGKGAAKKPALQKIYRAFSKDGIHFKFAGLKLASKKYNLMDPDMVLKSKGRYRIYFSRMAPSADTSDILSALYR